MLNRRILDRRLLFVKEKGGLAAFLLPGAINVSEEKSINKLSNNKVEPIDAVTKTSAIVNRIIASSHLKQQAASLISSTCYEFRSTNSKGLRNIW